jgi:streptomycin 6-kinase
VLKLQPPRKETSAALVGLRTWDGRGAVRLLDHDVERGAMLLERLNSSRAFACVEDDDVAMGILAGLQARLLAVPAPGNRRRLADIAAEMPEQVPRAVAALADPADRRLLRDWASATAELVDEPGTGCCTGTCTTARPRRGARTVAGRPSEAARRGPGLRPVARAGQRVGGDRDHRGPGTGRAAPVRPAHRGARSGPPARGRLDAGRLLQNALWDIEDGAAALDPSAVVLTRARRN